MESFLLLTLIRECILKFMFNKHTNHHPNYRSCRPLTELMYDHQILWMMKLE